jgi:hypothetical protein
VNRISRYYDNMERRSFLMIFPVSAVLLRAAENTARGKLTKSPTGDPALRESNGEFILLSGDEDTVGVLKDERLAGADFEVVGQTSTAGKFEVNPIHKRALFAYKDGKRLMVTYWCDVCAIRTYTPGICWCCRQETALDLIEPDKVDKE